MSRTQAILMGATMMTATVLSARNATPTREILPNGITLIHRHNPALPVVGTLVFLRMGAAWEAAAQSGLSVLLQAVVLKGTQSRTAEQLALEVENMGGAISASSGYDYAELTCTVGSGRFERSVEILADVMMRPTFPEEEIAKEKQALIASIRSRHDTIFPAAVDTLMEAMYGDHPYGRHNEGTEASVSSFGRDDLVRWWERFYGIDPEARNLVIVISGDVTRENARATIMRHFGNLRRIAHPESVMRPVVPVASAKTREVTFKQGYLMYGYLMPPESGAGVRERRYLSMKLLNAYLGGGMSGALFQILREKSSLGYETSCFFPTRVGQSHFVLYIGLDHARIALAREKIASVLSGVISGSLLTPEEFEDVKRKIAGRYLLERQTVLRQGWYLGFWEMTGFGFAFDERYPEAIHSLRLDDFRADVQALLVPAHETRVELVPR